VANVVETQVFNNKEVVVEGWIWALIASELKTGQVVGIDFLGKPLVLYRGRSGRPYALDAYCPHMGAHFKEGRVDGEGLRCAFHDWKFSGDGKCVEIPCSKFAAQTKVVPPVSSYQVAEHYGLIWIYAGEQGTEKDLPRFAELPNDSQVEWLVGPRTFRPCRPEVVMLNAIDAHHFNSVHPTASKLAGGMDLRVSVLSPKVIRLANASPVPKNHWLGRLLAPLYRKGTLTYSLDYWNASTGVVTLGPDFLHFHLLFPHRPNLQGGTDGVMVFLTPRRKGFLGWLKARLIVWITYLTGAYFERGDRRIFESIQFSMRVPIKADHPIIEFIRHTESQKCLALPWRRPQNRQGAAAFQEPRLETTTEESR